VLRDTDPGVTVVQFVDDPMSIERFVRDQSAKDEPVDQRGNANRVVTLARPIGQR